MRKQPKPSRPVLCLIDGYLGSIQEGRVGQGLAPHVVHAMKMLDRYPGRWAIIRSASKIDKTDVGIKSALFSERGYELRSMNGNMYARRPHRSGKPLEQTVTQLPPRRRDPLPAVEMDEFGWSPAEIDDALATANAWLFQTEGNLTA